MIKLLWSLFLLNAIIVLICVLATLEIDGLVIDCTGSILIMCLADILLVISSVVGYELPSIVLFVVMMIYMN